MATIVRLPGLIDIHVHLRDPGQISKEDFYTGTYAALAGGVTTVFDMPNNLEPIFWHDKLFEKLKIAGNKAVCDWGLYFGSDGKNIEEFPKIIDKVVGLKIYLNLTTGRFSIEDDSLVEKVFKNWPQNKVIVVHAEGKKVDLVIELAFKYRKKLHITHINDRIMLEKIIEAKKSGLAMTCDVTPHHLFLNKNNITAGLFVVKPPLAGKRDVEFLWNHLDAIDCIATDHAPHTLKEKDTTSPPGGIPGLETMLPLMLTAVIDKRLSIKDIIRMTNTNPQKIFGFSQDEDTYIEVDPQEKYLIENKGLNTKCGWSPFAGREVEGRVKTVFIRGKKVLENNKLLVAPGFGKRINPD
ncbi:amidohydrolase family protein [Candidatus Gottesmanbacteria bacterium]|nr:amidohydrolase family protein [Candidatus Gottesmanbacteria bacterium]